jgi:hypothetical protein
VNLEKELEDLEIESIKISALDKHYEDFNRGLEAYDNGDHEQAILCFKQITTEIDSELYAKAQLVLGIIYAEKDTLKVLLNAGSKYQKVRWIYMHKLNLI